MLLTNFDGARSEHNGNIVLSLLYHSMLTPVKTSISFAKLRYLKLFELHIFESTNENPIFFLNKILFQHVSDSLASIYHTGDRHIRGTLATGHRIGMILQDKQYLLSTCVCTDDGVTSVSCV